MHTGWEAPCYSGTEAEIAARFPELADRLPALIEQARASGEMVRFHILRHGLATRCLLWLPDTALPEVYLAVEEPPIDEPPQTLDDRVAALEERTSVNRGRAAILESRIQALEAAILPQQRPRRHRP